MNLRNMLCSLTLLLCGMCARSQSLSSLNLETFVQREADSMMLRLKLTEKQRETVKSLQQAYYNSVLALPATLTIDERTTRLTALVTQRDASLRQALTETQWSAHQAYLEQRKQTVQQAISERRSRHKQQAQNQ
ncbi:MAG TPA: hypothetical protein VHN59_00170 [Chitinophagaceae bacterium]|nr:hypothetical protein [Chitinophagaceae bacterium]